MPKSTGEEWFGAPAAAQYLGRVIRLRRVEVDAYIEHSRVRPGELDHLLYGPDPEDPGGRE